MSTSSQASLGALRLQAQQRADMENNPAISTAEWNQYISQSYKELYDLLIAAYGNDYFLANPYSFVTTGSQSYPLPNGTTTFRDSGGSILPKFYKLLGVDLQYSASPSGYVSLRRFEFIERNKYAYPNTATTFFGYTNLRYRVQGDDLNFVPLPTTGQTIRTWYAPAPTALTYLLPCSTTVSSTTIGLTDTTGLTAGMNVYGSGIRTNTTLSSVGSTTCILSDSATLTQASAILSMWNDSTLMDGIAGWEEYIVIDAAIKAQIKQENDITGLLMQKNEMKARIEAMSEGRDIGQAQHVSDVLGANVSGGGYDGQGGGMGGFGGSGWGW